MRKRKRKPTTWRHGVGGKGTRVTVEEKRKEGVLYIRAFDRTTGKYVRWSLGHRDKDRAKQEAADQHAKLAKGEAEFQSGKVTLARLFTAYQVRRSPDKSEAEQRADKRRVKMWTRFLGAQLDPHKLTEDDMEQFERARRDGKIDAQGNPTEGGRPVRQRVAQADILWLKWVLNWGVKNRDGERRYYLRENPLRGYEPEREKNPRRPVASHDRYEAVRTKTDAVLMQVVTVENGKRRRRKARSYLSEILDIVNGTGRRITAVCQLRYGDLKLHAGTHGKIRWPGETDKEGKEWDCPISPEVRAAIDRVLSERPGIGAAYLFPSPRDPSKPVSKDYVSKWLRAAEKLAELEPLNGSLWHAYRRKWVTERKHLPDADVAQAGGWSGTDALRASYQHADDATMYEVVMNPKRLREAK